MLDALTFDAGSTLTPDYMLMLDSRDITGNISDRLMSMTLTDNRGFEADQLDIELNDADGQVGLPVRGAVLTVYIGWKGFALVCKGKFTVDEVEHRGAPDVAPSAPGVQIFAGRSIPAVKAHGMTPRSVRLLRR